MPCGFFPGLPPRVVFQSIGSRAREEAGGWGVRSDASGELIKICRLPPFAGRERLDMEGRREGRAGKEHAGKPAARWGQLPAQAGTLPRGLTCRSTSAAACQRGRDRGCVCRGLPRRCEKPPGCCARHRGVMSCPGAGVVVGRLWVFRRCRGSVGCKQEGECEWEVSARAWAALGVLAVQAGFDVRVGCVDRVWCTGRDWCAGRVWYAGRVWCAGRVWRAGSLVYKTGGAGMDWCTGRVWCAQVGFGVLAEIDVQG